MAAHRCVLPQGFSWTPDVTPGMVESSHSCVFWNDPAGAEETLGLDDGFYKHSHRRSDGPIAQSETSAQAWFGTTRDSVPIASAS
jgi:hypothetical protein